jgi:hypothetical protein
MWNDARSSGRMTSGFPAERTGGRSFEPSCAPLSWRTLHPAEQTCGHSSWHLYAPTSCCSSWLIGWPTSYGTGDASRWCRPSAPDYWMRAHRSQRMMVTRWAWVTGYSQRVVGPSTPSRTSPSPYNEVRPSSLPPKLMCGATRRRSEARRRQPVNRTYNLHILRACASHARLGLPISLVRPAHGRAIISQHPLRSGTTSR